MRLRGSTDLLTGLLVDLVCSGWGPAFLVLAWLAFWEASSPSDRRLTRRRTARPAEATSRGTVCAGCVISAAPSRNSATSALPIRLGRLVCDLLSGRTAGNAGSRLLGTAAAVQAQQV